MSSHAVARLEKVDERIRSPLLGCLRIRYFFYRFTLLNSSQYYDVLTVRLGVFVFVLFNRLIISLGWRRLMREFARLCSVVLELDILSIDLLFLTLLNTMMF